MNFDPREAWHVQHRNDLEAEVRTHLLLPTVSSGRNRVGFGWAAVGDRSWRELPVSRLKRVAFPNPI